MVRKIYKKLRTISEINNGKKISNLIEKLEIKNGICFVDIGAAFGIHERFKKIESLLNYHGFEPDERARTDLLRIKNNCYKYTLHPNLIGEKKQDVVFNVCKGKGASSLLEPNFNFFKLFSHSARVEIVDKIKLSSSSIDEMNINDIDFIKMDIQGAELMALKGSKKSIGKVFGMELEVEFQEIYRNQPLFGEISEFLKEKGFNFYDFVNLRRWDRKNIQYPDMGQCIFGDALFLRSPEYMLENFKNNLNKLKKYIAICILYKKYDAAIYLCTRIDKKLISSCFLKKIEKLKLKSLKSKLFRMRINQFLNLISHQNEGIFLYD